MRRFLLAALLAASATTIAPPAAHAQAPDDPRSASATSWSLRAQAGGSITGRPEDGPGEVTLLLGTGFTGPAFGFEAGVRHLVTELVGVRAALGIVRAQGTGWANVDDTRRELTLSFVALELPVLLEVTWPPNAVVAPWAAVGVAPRVGVAASATESRTGFIEDRGAPAIARTTSLLLLGEAGIAFQQGRFRVPVGVRVAWNATYPATTRDRLPSFRSTEDPGAYLVENDLTVVATFGLDIGW